MNLPTISKMTNFAETLKQLMKERGISARVLSQATGIPQSTLSEWSGGREPKLGEQVIKLARFFGVSLEFLVTGEHIESDMVKDLIQNIKDDYTTIHQGVYRVRVEKLMDQKKKQKD
jgi:transcriptional regulator with XRE-family HTH domain